jgi:hypothetical protein
VGSEVPMDKRIQTRGPSVGRMLILSRVAGSSDLVLEVSDEY